MPEWGSDRRLVRLIDEWILVPTPWLAHRRDPAALLRRLGSCFGQWMVNWESEWQEVVVFILNSTRTSHGIDIDCIADRILSFFAQNC